MAEATKHDWSVNIAVVDSGANLVAFLRMDGALLASIAVAEHKARTAAKFRRPTKALEDAVQKLDYKFVCLLMMPSQPAGASRSSRTAKLSGRFGRSGGAGSQDEAVCIAGAATVKK